MMRRLGLFLMMTGLFCSMAMGQASNTMNFQGVVPPPPPTIVTLAPASGYVGAATTITVTGTNFAATCTATFDGAAVPFTFISATSGTIAVPAGKTVAGSNPIVVTCPAAVLSMQGKSGVQLPNGKTGSTYSANLATSLTITGGTPPYVWSLSSGTLPTGLTLSPAGVLSGTPSGAGTFNFTFTVKDSSGLALLRALPKIVSGGA
jgi:hypothetical protein